MQINYQFGDELIRIEARADGDDWIVTLPDGSDRTIHARRLIDDSVEIRTSEAEGARIFRVPFARTDRGVEFSWQGSPYGFAPVATGRPRVKQRRGTGLLIAPMVGTVVEVRVSEGDVVTAYQPVAVVEAMKVMAMLEAPFAGVVKRVYVAAGQRVEHGESIVEIVANEESERETAG